MSKFARNSPCPCGSGKKYKYCCLRPGPERGRWTPRAVTGFVALMMLALGFGVFAFVGRVFKPRSTDSKNSPPPKPNIEQAQNNPVPLPSEAGKPLPRPAKEAGPEEAQRDVDSTEFWRRFVDGGDCEGALQVARAITAISPDKSSGWLKQSYTLHELGRTEDAFQLLASVIEMFPDESLPAYNLACYACRAGRLNDARRWLKKSLEIAGDVIKANALKDSDLEPLWQEIKGW